MMEPKKNKLTQIPKRKSRIPPKSSKNVTEPVVEDKKINEEILEDPKSSFFKKQVVKPDKTLRKIRQELQIKFVGCFVLGAILIPVYPETFYGLLPLAAMVLYFVLGYPSMRITAAKPVFADSFYYLGFLFTFAALLIAITVKGSDITSITSQLGTALSTTIFGMLLRILISHFDPIETEVNTAVSDEMANMATQIRRLTEELTESIQEQLNAMMTISSASETQLSAINQALEKISNIDTPQESLNRFEEKISNVADGLNSLVSNANLAKNTLQEFSSSTSNVANSISASNQIVQDSLLTMGGMNII